MTAGLGRSGSDRREGGGREKRVRELHERIPFDPDNVAPDSESCVATNGRYRCARQNRERNRRHLFRNGAASAADGQTGVF